jgi:hypothetical protein
MDRSERIGLEFPASLKIVVLQDPEIRFFIGTCHAWPILIHNKPVIDQTSKGVRPISMCRWFQFVQQSIAEDKRDHAHPTQWRLFLATGTLNNRPLSSQRWKKCLLRPAWYVRTAGKYGCRAFPLPLRYHGSFLPAASTATLVW